MIVPARTFVPVVTFTPRRWEAESRPLREEAAPFFGGRFFAGAFLVGAFLAAGAFFVPPAFFAGVFFAAGAFSGVSPAGSFAGAARRAPPAEIAVISISEYRCRCPQRRRLFVFGL